MRCVSLLMCCTSKLNPPMINENGKWIDLSSNLQISALKLGSEFEDSGGAIQRSSKTIDLCICEFAVTRLDGLGQRR